MRMRAALLLLSPLVLVAAGCDLPAGTPASLGHDRAPNAAPADGALVPVPGTVRGSIDASDVTDWYRISGPATTSDLVLGCSTDLVALYLEVVHPNGDREGQSTVCSGIGARVAPGDSIELNVYDAGDAKDFTPYAITLTYDPLDG